MTYIASRSISRQASVCGTGEDDGVQGVSAQEEPPSAVIKSAGHRAFVPIFRTNGSMIRRTVVGVPLYSDPCSAV